MYLCLFSFFRVSLFSYEKRVSVIYEASQGFSGKGIYHLGVWFHVLFEAYKIFLYVSESG